MASCELQVMLPQNQLDVNRHPELQEQLNTQLSVAGAEHLGQWHLNITIYQRSPQGQTVLTANDIEKIYLFREASKPELDSHFVTYSKQSLQSGQTRSDPQSSNMLEFLLSSTLF